VIPETEYAGAPLCGVDTPSWPLTWSITPRHDMLKNVINLLVIAEDYRETRIMILSSDSLMVDEERTRPVGGSQVLQCSDNATWLG